MPASATPVRPCLEKNELTGKDLNWDDHDRLGRKHLADKLEKLVANSPGPYVIGLTSEWGSGKTVFLQCWKNDLQARNLPCVYFNAWETDHAKDPLVALLGSIKDTLGTCGFYTIGDDEKICTVGKKLFKKSPQIVFNVLCGVVNKATDGAIGDDLKEIIAELGSASVQEFLEIEKSRADFINELTTIAASVRNNEDKNPKKFPLFIMIDELDRCRPDYTVTLLERIKHLFHVPNVIFLLSFDGEQIFSVVEHTFGLKGDSSNGDLRQIYLSKFIDMFYKLPAPNKEDFVFNFLEKHAVPLPHDWNKMDSVADSDDELVKKLTGASSFYYVLASTTRHNKKSLRDCTQALSKFIVISRVYTLTWREAFWIFDMLMNQVSKLEQPEIASSITGSDFKIRWVESNVGYGDLDKIPLVFKENFKSFSCFKRYHGTDLFHAALYEIYLNLERFFKYAELLSSVAEKFDFIQDFDLEVPSDS